MYNELRSGQWQLGLCCPWKLHSGADLYFFDRVGGGVHNDRETFVFVDGHGSFHSTEPVIEYFIEANTYAFTYPPGVTPAEAEWWTMSFYPDYYPYIDRQTLP